MKNINVAVLGATGLVGQSIIDILQARNFPLENLYPLASARSAGDTIEFGRKTLDVIDVEEFDFSKVNIAIFSAGAAVSAKYAPIATSCGCIVIDNTSYFRQEADVPLIVPEINSADITGCVKRRIIANPNCSTIQMLMALNPIYQVAGISKINISTYQSVSGTGKAAIQELLNQTTELLSGHSITPKVYPYQIAFNLLPQIGEFLDNGFTAEEMKMVNETHKILGDYSILVNPTTVRVPVFYCHGEVITIETKEEISIAAVRKLLENAKGVKLLDDPQNGIYPTCAGDAIGSDDVFVGRLRKDPTNTKGINMWVVTDNTRKGAALNSVQIAEILFNDYNELLV
jgi:aspartate-semialdehyde dehydrogenase